MKALLLLGMLLIPSAAIAGRSAAYCPEIPQRFGMTWKYLEGGDFIGCIAIRSSDRAELFGVYIGEHPWSKVDVSRRKAKGVVGGRATHWQLPGPGADEDAVLESHLYLGPEEDGRRLQSVVWVYALPQVDYAQAFNAIANMRYRANWMERPPGS